VIDRFNSEGLEGLNPRPGFALQYLVCKEIEWIYGRTGIPNEL